MAIVINQVGVEVLKRFALELKQARTGRETRAAAWRLLETSKLPIITAKPEEATQLSFRLPDMYRGNQRSGSRAGRVEETQALVRAAFDLHGAPPAESESALLAVATVDLVNDIERGHDVSASDLARRIAEIASATNVSPGFVYTLVAQTLDWAYAVSAPVADVTGLMAALKKAVESMQQGRDAERSRERSEAG